MKSLFDFPCSPGRRLPIGSDGMGLFLSLNGVIGATRSEVVQGLGELCHQHGGSFTPATASEDEETRLLITTGRNGETILYPSHFVGLDPAAEFLSERLQKPCFTFHIHDGDLWMFSLYVGGNSVTAFNPIPEYWGKLPPAELNAMRGDPAMVAQHVPGLNFPMDEAGNVLGECFGFHADIED